MLIKTSKCDYVLKPTEKALLKASHLLTSEKVK